MGAVVLAWIFAEVLRDPSLDTTYFIVDALDECVTDLPKLLDFFIKHSSKSSRVKWIVSSRNWPDIEERLELAGHKVKLSLELNAESVSAAVGVFIEQKMSKLAHQKKYNTSTYNASDEAKLCKQMLASIALVYRPITLEELAALVEQLQDVDPESIWELVSLCGSFLTLRNETIYFVHQSAKDFLCANTLNEVFPSGRKESHYTIFSRSLQVMSKTLRRDMHSLVALGHSAERVHQPHKDPLAPSRYSCIYWANHLCDLNLTSLASYDNVLYDGGIIDVFLREKFLYWLEALSLCEGVPNGVATVAKLSSLFQACSLHNTIATILC
ncbi:hypothetical protein EK21DRAFT_105458 [Setomelanomma holmii]|uniref:NACHT domain-containing protein n=1 Tax=Setomelanomma holmii TaxID=210430 RepID=A0A9P4GWT2_9PLEO|nr:hypothetical protein EK21DRAFT_105458 [Setomelanomma holmii]